MHRRYLECWRVLFLLLFLMRIVISGMLHPRDDWEFDDILLRHCNVVHNQNTIDRWTKGCIFPFPKKGDHGIAKNYQDITLTSIAANAYNALLHNNIETKIEKILGNKPKWLSEKWINDITNFGYPSNSRRYKCKKPRGDNIICRLPQAFDSINSGKMEQILLAYGLPEETVTAIMMLYKSQK